MTEPRGRPIEDVEQARAVVDGDKASFVELIECAEVGKSAADWQLRKDAAERAVNLAVSNSRQTVSVHLAARHLAAATLGEANDLNDLARYVEALRKRIKQLLVDFPETVRNAKLLKLEATVSEIAVLLTYPEPPAQVRLCSRLRELDRADLGVKAAERGLRAEPKNAALLTTLAAAQLDIGASTSGLGTIKQAVDADPENVYALNVYSRALQENMRLDESLEVAQTAFELDANHFTAQRILGVAAQLKDSAAFDAAFQFVRQHQAELSDEADVYVLLLAVEALVEGDDFTRARALFEELEAKVNKDGLAGLQAKKFSALRKRLQAFVQPTLPMGWTKEGEADSGGA